MAPRKGPKSGSPSPGARREAKHGGNKNGKKEGISGSSFFTWFMVIALLGVWTSVAVVWFELVDYEEVLAKAKDFRYNLSEVLQGKLGIYDADGDGDFDVEDAKVLLGLKERSVQEQPNLKESEEVIQPAKETYTRSEHRSADKAEPDDEIQSLLREVLESQLEEETSDVDEENKQEETNFQEDAEDNEISEAPNLEEDYGEELEDKIPEVLETLESFQEDPAKEPEVDDIHVTYEYHTHVEEDMYQPESPDERELTLEDALEYTEDTEQQDYVDERDFKNEDFIEVRDTDGEPLTEYHYENIQGEPVDSTEQNQELDGREHAEEDHKDTQPHHETEIPVQVEDYSNDDLVDT